MRSTILVLVLLANVANAKTTITSNKDSMGVTHSKIETDGRTVQRCRTIVDSMKVSHTVCDKQ
jgi:hypothetical protein